MAQPPPDAGAGLTSPPPTIRHLVLQGGGAIGLNYVGALQQLFSDGVIRPGSLKSVFGTSIGALIGGMVCIGVDWSDVVEYIIRRPWESAFCVTGRSILSVYGEKGLFDERVIHTVLRSLMDSVGLSSATTLEELYAHSGIDLHTFAFDVNAGATVDMSHETHPNMHLVSAIFASLALPGACKPHITEAGGCFIDGGVRCNYPVAECLRKYPDDEAEVLGLRYMCRNACEGDGRYRITRDTNFIDYTVELMSILYAQISDRRDARAPHREIVCVCDTSPLSIHAIVAAVLHKSVRRDRVSAGAAAAAAADAWVRVSADSAD